MTWPFNKPRITSGGPQNAGFEETLAGVQYKAVWKEKAQPDPGAQAFAYETYGLVAMPPSGPSIVALNNRMRAYYMSPDVSKPGTIIRGLGTVQGQIYSQPLLNPYSDVGKPIGGQV